jgi:formate hydrogenlyase subunit 6/NADH:ubiquinone oxidoreductase subunit I
MVTKKVKGKEALLPEIDRSKCIKCFCCQEFCPKGAMKVHENPIGKMINRK